MGIVTTAILGNTKIQNVAQIFEQDTTVRPPKTKPQPVTGPVNISGSNGFKRTKI